MCFLKPLKVKKIWGTKVVFENGLIAHYNKKIGELKKNDEVLVFGNLVIEKITAAVNGQEK